MRKRPGLTLSAMGASTEDEGAGQRGEVGMPVWVGMMGEQGGTPFSNFRKIV